MPRNNSSATWIKYVQANNEGIQGDFAAANANDPQPITSVSLDFLNRNAFPNKDIYLNKNKRRNNLFTFYNNKNI